MIELTGGSDYNRLPTFSGAGGRGEFPFLFSCSSSRSNHGNTCSDTSASFSAPLPRLSPVATPALRCRATAEHSLRLPVCHWHRWLDDHWTLARIEGNSVQLAIRAHVEFRLGNYNNVPSRQTRRVNKCCFSTTKISSGKNFNCTNFMRAEFYQMYTCS